MTSSQSRKISGKTVALVLLVAIVTAVIVTVVQQLVLGKSNVAVTGGVVGAVMGAMAISIMRKSSG